MIRTQDLPAEVHVLVPFDAARRSPDFDTPEFRAELDAWFGPLGLRWHWVPVSPGEADGIARRLRAQHVAAGLVAFNLCDGDELDGFPGLSVIEALERYGLPFTGADAAFYRISTSKLAMKTAFAHAAVRAPAHALLSHPTADFGAEARRIADELGFPCIVKLDIACAGYGLDRHSVASDVVGLEHALAAAGRCSLGGARGVFAERYVAAAESTVLVCGDASRPDEIITFPGVAMDFFPATPANERILFHGHRDAPSPHATDGRDSHCRYRVAPGYAQASMQALARRAYAAVAGRGYARVDMRWDERGEGYVLEVNANCALSRDEPTIGPALEAAGVDISRLAAMIMASACRIAAERKAC